MQFEDTSGCGIIPICSGCSLARDNFYQLFLVHCRQMGIEVKSYRPCDRAVSEQINHSVDSSQSLLHFFKWAHSTKLFEGRYEIFLHPLLRGKHY